MANQSASEEPTSDGAGGQEQQPRSKDKWARIYGSLPTAIAVIVVAVMGAVINSTINRSQMNIQKEIAKAQLITDQFALYANRETAVDSLRADVFGVLAQHIVTEIEEPEFRKVALLSAFHGNFSKFIDTRPVFEAFLTEIECSLAREELRRLAKRVARRQADYIEAHGGDRDRAKVCWRPGGGDGKFDLHDHTIQVCIEDVKITGVDDVGNTVDVKVALDENPPVEFTLSYLDAPYIDNIFVVHRDEDGEVMEVHRIALLLLDITEGDDCEYEVELEALHFPADIILPMDVPSAEQLQNALAPSDSEDAHTHE